MSKCKDCFCNCHCNVNGHSDDTGVCPCEKCNCNPQGAKVNEEKNLEHVVSSTNSKKKTSKTPTNTK